MEHRETRYRKLQSSSILNSPCISVEVDTSTSVVTIAALFTDTVTSCPSFSDMAVSKACKIISSAKYMHHLTKESFTKHNLFMTL